MALVLPHVSQGEEPDAAQDNQPHYGEIHQWVPRIAGQGDEGRARRPHQVEPGVAEGRDGMPVAVIDAPDPILGIESDGQEGAEHPLDHRRILGDPQAPPRTPVQFSTDPRMITRSANGIFSILL